MLDRATNEAESQERRAIVQASRALCTQGALGCGANVVLSSGVRCLKKKGRKSDGRMIWNKDLTFKNIWQLGRWRRERNQKDLPFQNTLTKKLFEKSSSG